MNIYYSFSQHYYSLNRKFISNTNYTLYAWSNNSTISSSVPLRGLENALPSFKAFFDINLKSLGSAPTAFILAGMSTSSEIHSRAEIPFSDTSILPKPSTFPPKKTAIFTKHFRLAIIFQCIVLSP